MTESPFTRDLVHVHDHLLYDPKGYRDFALALPYHDIVIGEDIFRGIAPTDDPRLPTLLRALYGDDLQVTLSGVDGLSFFRKSPRGQLEPNYIHSDAAMGDVTAILYLHPAPPPGDGTTFWERTATGHTYGPWDDETARAAKDLRLWTPWRTVPAQFGRLLVFRSDLFHSRAIPENYGEDQDARLTQVAFARWGTSA
jgi:hypothetical protein